MNPIDAPATHFLDQACAAKGKPIRLGDLSPHKATCRPMDEERRQFLRKKISGTPSQAVLVGPLVAFGGEFALVPSLEEDLDYLLKRGQLWGATGKMMPGAPGQCHMNSALLWEANQDKLFLATGYALSDDGLWRPHSWCIHPGKTKPSVIETTVKRELYFGFVMNLEETLRFAFNNSDFGVDVHETTAKRYEFEVEKIVPAKPKRLRMG